MDSRVESDKWSIGLFLPGYIIGSTPKYIRLDDILPRQ
jgi:hypothetical protein